ncbi:type IV pilus biogenesis protein PilM [Chloroflexota bacterium]
MTTRITALLIKIISRAKTALLRRVVTLDISNDSVRLLEIRNGNVYQWASASLETDEGEAVSVQSVLGTKTKQLMTSTGIKAKRVMVSFSGLYSIYRVIPLSSLPKEPLTQEAVQEIARNVLPIPLNELRFSWKRILASDGIESIHLFGIPRNVLEEIVQELKSVDITPCTLEPRAFALTRLINRTQALILNVEPTTIEIVLVTNDVPKIIRAVSWHQSELAPEAQVEFLERNLERTVDFHNSHHIEPILGPATPLFITGQASVEQTLLDNLQNRLEYKIEPLPPLLNCPEHLPISQYASNIGLVSQGSMSAHTTDRRRYSPLTINIWPQIHRPWRLSATQLYSLAFIAIALALLMPALQFTQKAMNETANLQTKRDILNEKLLQQKNEIGKRLPFERAVKDYQIIIGMNTHLTEDIEVINEQAEKVGIILESVSHKGTDWSIECTSDNYTVFRNYMAALEESGNFNTPIPPPEGYPYTTSGTIKLTSTKGSK